MRQAIAQRQAGLLTYGITPPKKSFDEARRRELARRQVERIARLPVDGLVIYDLQDESTRTDAVRPFPFMATVDPVSVPRWLENELLHARDILQTSVDLCCEVFANLLGYARAKGIPLGCNVESVSLRREEIDASVELVTRVASLLGRSKS